MSDWYRILSKSDEAMKKVAIGFSCHSNSVRRGAIGAIDDWLVCITRPWEYFYDVASLVTFYSRNDVYALNVQCLVDHEKIVLWAFYSHRGSSHDSTYFRATILYKKLLKQCNYICFLCHTSH